MEHPAIPTSMQASKTQAIQSALSQDWEQAVKHNLAILTQTPDNIEALNRLAFAYLQIGDFSKARSTYKHVLSLDRYNVIAQKNMQKVKMQAVAKAKNREKGENVVISPSLFLEEPGKTKIVALINVAPSNVLYAHSIGEQLILVAKRHTLEVRSLKKEYLGAFPDDLGFRLYRLIKSGNKYDVFIKAVGKNSLTVFIQEIKRSKRFRNQPTFPTTGDLPIYSYIHRESGVDDELFPGESGDGEASEE